MTAHDRPESSPHERRLLDRLGHLYLERLPQPRLSRAPLTIWEFYRFSRYIRAEGYGEGATEAASSSPPATRNVPPNRSD